MDGYESGDGMPLLDIDASDLEKGIIKVQGRPKKAKNSDNDTEDSTDVSSEEEGMLL